MKIGFIGTGVMGTGIINNLLKNNYDVTVYKRRLTLNQSWIMELSGQIIQLP